MAAFGEPFPRPGGFGGIGDKLPGHIRVISTFIFHLNPSPATPLAMNFTSGAGVSELLSLDHIRSQLIRLEDTIIFCERERQEGSSSRVV